MSIVLAGDFGPSVGLGHRRRLEAIGTALAAMGYGSTFVPIDGSGDNDAWGQDLAVVDSYLTRADDQAAYPVGRIVAIDELGRDLAVDLVIDPTPGARISDYRGSPQRVLGGAEYALVDPALAACESRSSMTVATTLVTFGASERAASDAISLADAIHTQCPAVRLKVAVGPWADVPRTGAYELIDAPDGLADVLAAADLVVTAGGVTMLEACALGRPVVAVAIAENQRNAVRAMAALGAVMEADAASIVSAVEDLISDSGRRMTLAARAREVIDGRGAERAATAIVELLETPR